MVNEAQLRPVIALDDVSKSFGAIRALRGVHLELIGGEVHALVGENGAGKSTLIKILAGVHQPDAGRVLLDGATVTFQNTAEAMAAGIAVIYQEPTLFPDLSVAENIYIGRQPRGRMGTIDGRAMTAMAAELFTRLAVAVDPARPAQGLSIADQQIVEIAKAISRGARILIMDEPTAALSGIEVERLFSVVRSLREQGTAILFISHRFDEITALCDRVTILRDGAFVSTDRMADLTVPEMVRRMVGRELSVLFPKRDVPPGEVVLEVDGLSRQGVFADIGFTVQAGEIVALAGLVGSGRSEVVQSIFGVDPRDSGTVRINGKEIPPSDSKAAMAAGAALVPEDRRQQGLVLDMSITRNVTLTRSWALSAMGFLTGRTEREEAKTWTSRLQTKYGQLSAPVSQLSGGNQQKVVLAKWLSTAPRLLIVDEPTRGIDVGTKAEVHRLMSDLAAEGVALLMVSSELPEVLGMADRVLVMREGRITAEIPRAQATEESVMLRCDRPGGARMSAIAAPPRPQTGSDTLGLLLRGRTAGLFVVLALLVGGTALANPRFLSAQSVRDLLLASTIILVLSAGMTMVILTRGIDLSVGAVLGLSAFLTATVLSRYPGIPVLLAVLVGLAVGAACGLVNGVLIADGKVPALVATLGTLYVFRGVVYFVAGGSRINAGNMPRGFLDFGTSRILGVPVPDAHRRRRGGGRRASTSPGTAPAATSTPSARARGRPSWRASRSPSGS